MILATIISITVINTIIMIKIAVIRNDRAGNQVPRHRHTEKLDRFCDCCALLAEKADSNGSVVAATVVIIIIYNNYHNINNNSNSCRSDQASQRNRHARQPR